MVNLCDQCDVKTANTFFAHKYIHKRNLESITNEDWVHYFKDLLEEKYIKFQGEQYQIHNLTHTNPQLKQVQQAVKDTKIRKSPGPGRVQPEFIKLCI